MENTIIQGIDIGGSHITAALVDLNERLVVPGTLIRQKVNPHGSADEIIEVWTEACSQVFQQYQGNDKKISIAMPGPFDYENGISFIKNMNKYDSLYGMNIREILAKNVGLHPSNILFRNDAEAFLHGEVFCGSARGFEKAIGITLGTGLGSARSTGGITKDANLGVSPFLDGIAEDYLSTRWFIKRYAEYSGCLINGVKELTELPANDPHVMLVLEEFSTNLALFLTGFIRKEKSDVVVIGGNITKLSGMFLAKVKESISNCSLNVSLQISELGEDAALIGAASLWWNKEGFYNENEAQLAGAKAE